MVGTLVRGGSFLGQSGRLRSGHGTKCLEPALALALGLALFLSQCQACGQYSESWTVQFTPLSPKRNLHLGSYVLRRHFQIFVAITDRCLLHIILPIDFSLQTKCCWCFFTPFWNGSGNGKSNHLRVRFYSLCCRKSAIAWQHKNSVGEKHEKLADKLNLLTIKCLFLQGSQQ